MIKFLPQIDTVGAFLAEEFVYLASPGLIASLPYAAPAYSTYPVAEQGKELVGLGCVEATRGHVDPEEQVRFMAFSFIRLLWGLVSARLPLLRDWTIIKRELCPVFWLEVSPDSCQCPVRVVRKRLVDDRGERPNDQGLILAGDHGLERSGK
jgi:hypothetical protein